uniref:NADH dehydrogenase subunit 11 n=1 Tax=Gloeochaete wittrockiana TaxID=38269 RepID=A0A096Y6T3_9EUKA|nr:NADH dehydrogenase subunit 11 [Gloeochaete wittrockiana]AIM52045.1 NADH dehydrogenase subunit 11 [Gloeochaete wittrockiana]
MSSIFVKYIGALTSKPYAFAARPWELKSIETLDVFDSVGANIRVDIRGDAIMRILPSLNEEINEEWLSDKSRFAYDGLRLQRLYTPFVKIGGNLTSVSWKKAFDVILHNLVDRNPGEIGGFVGRSVDMESIYLLRKLFFKLGSSNVFSSEVSTSDIDFRASYVLTSGLKGLENSDFVMIVGFNPKIELPLLNVRLRRLALEKKVTLVYLGNNIVLNYSYKNLGSDMNTFVKIVEGRHHMTKFIKKASKPLVLVGTSFFKQSSFVSSVIIQHLSHFLSKINSNFGVSLVTTFSGQMGGFDLGLRNIDFNLLQKLKFVYLLGADDFDYETLRIFRQKNNSGGKLFVVYQGHHGDLGAELADVILPGSAYTEKNASFTNLEGRVQRTRAIFLPPGQSREDWKIINALSDFVGKTLHYNNLDNILSDIAILVPSFKNVSVRCVPRFFIFKDFSSGFSIYYNYPLVITSDNFYGTDPISRSSVTMTKCASSFLFSNPVNF